MRCLLPVLPAATLTLGLALIACGDNTHDHDHGADAAPGAASAAQPTTRVRHTLNRCRFLESTEMAIGYIFRACVRESFLAPAQAVPLLMVPCNCRTMQDREPRPTPTVASTRHRP